MNDTQRSRRPATPSPRTSRQAPAQLGELEFSDWYEIPVFEPDEDELTEETATTGRGPRRMMAKAKLAREARRAQRHPDWDAAPRRTAGPAPSPAPPARRATPAPTAPEPAPAPRAAEADRRARAAGPTGAAVTREMPSTAPANPPAGAAAADPATAPGPAAADSRPAPPDKPAPRPARSHARPATPAATKAPTQPADADTWMTSGPALTEESMQLDLERESVWRRRINDFLDRWAASEVAAQHRLDDSIEHLMSRGIPKSIPDLLAATRRGGSR